MNNFKQAFATAFRSGEQQRPIAAALPFSQMNPEQKTVLTLFRQQLDDRNSPHKRVLVQGKAGTGKSAIIKFMREKLELSHKRYLLLAPTGAAAINIDGKTIHSALNISIQGPVIPLEGEALRRFQLRHSGISFVIIDEYSMVGLRMLNRIHMRLCEATGSTELFGGVFIYLFGDVRQLPPVRDIPVYSSPLDDFSTRGKSLIDSFSDKFILTRPQRQSPDQIRFIEILDNLAIGRSTQDDVNLPNERRHALSPSNIGSFTSAVYLYPINAKVREHNMRR